MELSLQFCSGLLFVCFVLFLRIKCLTTQVTLNSGQTPVSYSPLSFKIILRRNLFISKEKALGYKKTYIDFQLNGMYQNVLYLFLLQNLSFYTLNIVSFRRLEATQGQSFHIYSFLVLEFEPQASWMLNTQSTTESRRPGQYSPSYQVPNSQLPLPHFAKDSSIHRDTG